MPLQVCIQNSSLRRGTSDIKVFTLPVFLKRFFKAESIMSKNAGVSIKRCMHNEMLVRKPTSKAQCGDG